MEKRLIIGFLNIIKWLVAIIIVLVAVWSKEYKILGFLTAPALGDVFTIIILMDKNEKL
jgi:hypothetical protein